LQSSPFSIREKQVIFGMLNKSPFLFTVPLIALFAILYFMGMGTVVGYIDHGELLAGQYHWGVVHATGYPLFTLLGHFWSKLPFGIDMVIQLNLLSLIFVLGFLALASYTFQQILQRTALFTLQQIGIISLICVGLLGIHSVIWSQALASEVYSLHLLLFMWVVNRLLQAYNTQKQKDWLWFAVALGLSFSNHLTTLLIFPAAAYCYFIPLKSNELKPKLILLALMAAISIAIAFSFYGIMVWRAFQNPIINWGNPVTWDSFWFHVFGRQFSNFFEGSKGFGKRFIPFISDSVYFIYLIPVALWLIKSFKEFRPITIIGGITWLACGLFSACYNIHDISNYYTTGVIGLSLLTLGGISFVVKNQNTYLVLGVCSVLVIGLAAYQYPYLEQKSHIAADVITRKTLTDLPPNAVVISKAWEIFISPSLYLQTVEGIRKDVQVIDQELLRRDYYKNQLDNLHPQITSAWEPEYSAFIQEVQKFQYGKKFDGDKIQTLYEDFLAKLLTTSLASHPVFFTPEAYADLAQNKDWKMPDGYEIAPQGLVFQVVKKGTPYIEDKPLDFKDLHISSKYWLGTESDIARLFTNMLMARGKYEYEHGKLNLAEAIRVKLDEIPTLKKAPKKTK